MHRIVCSNSIVYLGSDILLAQSIYDSYVRCSKHGEAHAGQPVVWLVGTRMMTVIEHHPGDERTMVN